MKRAQHISGTQRAFAARKRRELRAVREAVNVLMIGCAFLPHPIERKVTVLRETVNQIALDLRGWR